MRGPASSTPASVISVVAQGVLESVTVRSDTDASACTGSRDGLSPPPHAAMTAVATTAARRLFTDFFHVLGRLCATLGLLTVFIR
jgi:hypothetical protein